MFVLQHRTTDPGGAKVNTLLIINSSPRQNSVSRRLTRRLCDEWKMKNPDGRVLERDLASHTLPFLTESWIQASYTPAAQRTAEHQQTLALSDTLIEELLAADLIVLGVPMHNFSIPASLKAWIDLITRAGKTFSYGDTGPKGLIPSDKKVLVIVTRGGAYGAGSPADFQVPYLRHMLGFIGLSDVTVIDVDRQGSTGDAAQKSVDRAIAELSAMAESCTSDSAVA
jgi:FMN-dependent NADH-azoreductase